MPQLPHPPDRYPKGGMVFSKSSTYLPVFHRYFQYCGSAAQGADPLPLRVAKADKKDPKA
jgi:hypothetical protein